VIDMEENLVGYLLNALDGETQREVEASLRKSPELQSRLELLERALAPLAVDREMPEPHPGLVLSTLARIAEYKCRKLPDAPPPPRSQSAPVVRPWPRRADALVAALLLLVLGGLGSSFLLHLWRDYHGRAECRNNLFLIWKGLQSYCDAHEGNFPTVEAKGPHSVAGIFLPVLGDSGMLGPEISVTCPAQERRPPELRSVKELEELYQSNPEAFRLEVRRLAGGYAYTLGYHDAAGYHGLRCDSVESGSLKLLPIVADRLDSLSQRNSANHGGEGQNVLYLDGHVEWRTNRNAGINGDDIFVNWDNQVLAGKAREDTVLGSGDATPSPRE
jgi:prepilin-type processing-associated H-X9-DG protein